MVISRIPLKINIFLAVLTFKPVFYSFPVKCWMDVLHTLVLQSWTEKGKWALKNPWIMDIFLWAFCCTVAELTPAISKKWVWFSCVWAIQNCILASALYECSFKPVDLAKVKRNFVFINPGPHSEKLSTKVYMWHSNV